jgi:putative transposase
VKTRRAYKFKLKPTRKQEKLLEGQLGLCRELYNAALQERRDAYKRAGKSISYVDQANQLPEIKVERPDLAEVHSQVLQDVLKRVEKAFKGFFSRIKLGVKAGYPRFRGLDRYDSFTYPQGGWSLTNDRLTLSKLGTFKVKLHRNVAGKVKTCTIKREGESWFVVFSVEYEFEPPTDHPGRAVGIDVGLENFANLSNGEQIANPRFFRKSEKQLAKVQRKLAKLKQMPRTNPGKIKAKRAASRAFKRIRNQRLDFAHKLSRKLVTDYSLIAVEDLNIKGLASGMLAKGVNDAAWSLFTALLSYKAELAVTETGSKLVKVDPRYTSQICPNCGAVAKKELAVRWHSCECGCELHRDVAAAQVILSRGLATLSNQSVDAPPARSGV